MLKRDMALNPFKVIVKGRVPDEEIDGLPELRFWYRGTSRGMATDIDGETLNSEQRQME